MFLLREECSLFDPDKILWLPPSKIINYPQREFDFENFKGVVLAGEWDRVNPKDPCHGKFEELDVYQSLKEVVLEGKSWKETLYFQRILEAVKKGGVLYNCVNEDDLNRRCKNIEALFCAIRDHGYKTQRELMKSAPFAERFVAHGEVTVSIGRDGDFLFSSGAHRLAVAKILSIPRIPVNVAVRHKEWARFAGELARYARTHGGRLYQPACHPDLADIPAFHDCEESFRVIRENVSVREGRVLDIRTNLGYFCHAFEDDGYECYAVEEDPEECRFLRKLRRANHKKFAIVAENIYDWPQIGLIYFDIVLALNVFHHALKTKEFSHKLAELLQECHMRELFIELPADEEIDGVYYRDFYTKYSMRGFLDFIMESSRFKKAEAIGLEGDRRMIYKLSQRGSV